MIDTIPASEAAVAAFLWAPEEGNASVHDPAGRATLVLDGLAFAAFRAALRLDDPGLTLLLDAYDGIGFLGRDGQPRAASGTLRCNGATLRFAGIAKIRLG
jgi:hypothetical protein